MNYKQYLLFIPILLLMIGCNGKKSNNNNDEKKQYTAELVNSIDSFGDSVYFSLTQCITLQDNKIYMGDYKNNRIIVFSKDLELIDVFGESGHGPGELQFPDKLFISDKSLYVEGNLRISEFGLNGSFKQTIKMPENNAALQTRFAVKDDKLIASGIKNQILIFNKQGDLRNEFGGYHNSGYVPEKYWPQVRSHVFVNGSGQIICASAFDPVIELYSANHKLLSRLVYDDLDFMNEKWQSLQSFYTSDNNNNNMQKLVMDAYYTNNKLYLLLINTILVFDVEKDQITFDKQIIFDEDKESDYFMSLAVDKEKMYLFNHVRGTIEMYKLN